MMPRSGPPRARVQGSRGPAPVVPGPGALPPGWRARVPCCTGKRGTPALWSNFRVGTWSRSPRCIAPGSRGGRDSPGTVRPHRCGTGGIAEGGPVHAAEPRQCSFCGTCARTPPMALRRGAPCVRGRLGRPRSRGSVPLAGLSALAGGRPASGPRQCPHLRLWLRAPRVVQARMGLPVPGPVGCSGAAFPSAGRSRPPRRAPGVAASRIQLARSSPVCTPRCSKYCVMCAAASRPMPVTLHVQVAAAGATSGVSRYRSASHIASHGSSSGADDAPHSRMAASSCAASCPAGLPSPTQGGAVSSASSSESAPSSRT